MRIEKVGQGMKGIGKFIIDHPYITIGIVIVIFVILHFARQREEPREVQPAHEPLLDYGHLFEQIKQKQEMLGLQQKKVLDLLKAERLKVDPIGVYDPGRIDWYALDPVEYKRRVLRQPIGVGRVGEDVHEVIRRQRERYERALARGDLLWAEIVRRETEQAIGRRLEW